jgi:predicted O-methyltransferase YrrM
MPDTEVLDATHQLLWSEHSTRLSRSFASIDHACEPYVDSMVPNGVLKEIFATGIVHTSEGQPRPLHSNVNKAYAEALYRLVKRERPQNVLEVGLAYGISALAILTALEENGSGRLVSIDPKQSVESEHDWWGIGVTNIAKAGLTHRHELIEDFDYLVLPRLLAEGRRIDLAYIDGWHTFDYTMLDLFYCDKLLKVGGIVGVNDLGFTAVDRAVRWFTSHRRYEEIDVGLPWIRTRSRWRHRAHNVAKRAGGLINEDLAPVPVGWEDKYFRKSEDWEPDWDFYAPF